MTIEQSVLYAVIRAYVWQVWRTTATIPTIYELARHMKCHKTTAKRHVDALQAVGDWPPVVGAPPAPKKHSRAEIQALAHAVLVQRGLR